jgi:UDP-N-acetylmuramate dehydrogenase
MEIIPNQPLEQYNTFGVQATAKQFIAVKKVAEAVEILQGKKSKNVPLMILGEGSNVLFTGDFEGLILKNEIGGIHVVREDDDYVWVKAGGGVIWHQLVESCIRAGFGGIENLSLIPGTVGAAPVQNIGAYGVELREVMEALEAYELKTGKKRYFRNNECRFGYRDSIFKNELRQQFIITNVILRLDKTPKFNLSYGVLQETIEPVHPGKLTLRHVSDAVIKIRSSKLPDPSKTGNAGSFFKNPNVSRQTYHRLRMKHPDLPGFEQDEDNVKIPAGWLIEQCGWKGKRLGNAGVHENQALVIVNYGGATGKEILDVAEKIRASVLKRFGINLIPEVNIL